MTQEEEPRITNLHKYGKIYLNQDELKKRQKQLSNNYHRFLARKVFEFNGLSYWNYHKSEINKTGFSINPLKSFLCILYQVTLPVETYYHLIKGIKNIMSKNDTTSELDAISKTYCIK